MKRIAFFDTKPYDRIWFDEYNDGRYELVYFEGKLNHHSAKVTADFDGVCAFVNDEVDAKTIDILEKNNVGILAMRSAGFSNVDLKAAKDRIKVVRVPAYSPYAVAEHAMGLLLTVNRKLARAVSRTRDFNFSINGLMGVDLYGKTVGVIGTGIIGRVFINICRGFGMKVIAYDPYPVKDSEIEYVDLDTLFENMKATITEPQKQITYICHGDCIADAEYLAKRMKEELGVPEVIIGYTGPVIAAHSGPGTLAVFYVGTER